MAITPFNVIQGPALVYVAPFGTSLTSYIATDPATVPVATPFVGIGGTTGGVVVEIDETMSDIHVDQLLDPVGARTTARTIQVTTTMMETELSNLTLALNGAVTSLSGTNYTGISPTTTTSATQPTYSALIIDGWAPTLSAGGAATRRFIVQKVLSQPKISVKYDMTNQATVAVTFTAYYVSSATSPITILDSSSGAVNDTL